MRTRRGFALLAVLWIIVGGAVVSFAISLAAREAIATSYNRMTLTRATWEAEDCLGRSLAALDALMRTDRMSPLRRSPPPTDSMELLLSRVPSVEGCPGHVSLRPTGLALNINSATAEMLRQLLRSEGFDRPALDSMVDAIMDWRDADDITRPFGCERECYRSRGTPEPADSALASVGELALVRGFEGWDERANGRHSGGTLAALFTVEPGRVVLDRAPASVLAALPGIGESGARAIKDWLRLHQVAFRDLRDVETALPSAGRDSFKLRYAELGAVATVQPDAWVLTINAPREGEPGSPAPSASFLVRLSLGNTGARIIRRRLLP